MDNTPGLSAQPSGLLRALVEQSLGLMCVHALDGTLLFVNAAAAESLGFRPEDGLGWNLRRFLAPAVVAEFDAYLERIRANGVDSGLMRLVAKDGSERVWLYRNVLHAEAGAPPCVLGHAQDVTERVRAERALRESERRFRLLADTTPILIWLSDDSGACTFVNEPWLSFTGRSAAEHHGEGWTHHVHPDDRPRVIDAYWTAVSAQAPFRAEFRLRRIDGEYRWMIGHGVPRRGEDGSFAGLVGSCVDVTEERRAREMLEVARTRRIESLGVLAGGIAHEFNNLLTVIGGRIQLLLDRLAADEPACHDLHLIQRSAQRAAALTQQLLAFGRRQLLQPHLVDLNQFVNELSLARAVGERVEVVLHLEEPLRRVHVDPGQLKRAIVHLVENACEAMPDGGRLVIETANADLDEAFVHLHPGAAAGPHVRLTIRDTGVGLDEATRSRIFEPFFTPKPGGRGSGLNLPAVYGIAAQHGGYVAVESERHRGTAFTMYLPAVGAEGAGRPGGGRDGRRGAEGILLLEPDRDVCLLLRDILEPHGYRLVDAGDADEAAALLARPNASVDLVVTSADAGSAPEARLRAGRPDLRLLYLGAPPCARASEEPSTRYLPRPFTVESLLTAVREVLDGRGPDRRA